MRAVIVALVVPFFKNSGNLYIIRADIQRAFQENRKLKGRPQGRPFHIVLCFFQQDADRGQHRERGAGCNGPFQFGAVHSDRHPRAVRPYEEHDTHQGDKQDDAAADEVQDRTVQLRHDGPGAPPSVAI